MLVMNEQTGFSVKLFLDLSLSISLILYLFENYSYVGTHLFIACTMYILGACSLYP